MTTLADLSVLIASRPAPGFTVETYALDRTAGTPIPVDGHADAAAVVHVLVPRTVLLDVVADMVIHAGSPYSVLTGEMVGGDDARERCEPDSGEGDDVHLHVYVRDGRLSAARAATLVGLSVARHAGQTPVAALTRSVHVSQVADWSEPLPLLS